MRFFISSQSLSGYVLDDWTSGTKADSTFSYDFRTINELLQHRTRIFSHLYQHRIRPI